MDIYKLTESGTYICLDCNQEFKTRKGFCKHYDKEHVCVSGVEGLAAVSKLNHAEISNIPLPILEEYYGYIIDDLSDEKKTNNQLVTFYNQITSIRPFNIKKDIKNFFENVLPWREKHPNNAINEELSRIIFQDPKEASIFYSNEQEKYKNSRNN